MMKLTFGLITALLLAACAATEPQTPSAAQSGMTSGVGHPSASYPGPRPY
jgi:hypothetical protein